MEHMETYDILQPVQHTKKREITGGQGAALFSSDGSVYLDFNEICVTLGQNNRHFIERMTGRLQGLTSNKAGYGPDKEKLMAFLTDTTGHAFSAIHLTASGSEAAEWAVRMALKLTGKSEILSFWNSIHGRTYLSASMSGLPKRKTDYGPIAPGVVFAPYPDCAHCPFEKQCRPGEFFCLRFLEEKIRYESAGDIGAVIVEAYQGGGVILPPAGYLKALQDWTHAHGALFILDEIQSGMGRTGQLYRYPAEGLDPDMLLLGKSLGNGLHISALLTKNTPDPRYIHALTGGAGDDALACTAACAVFEELLENGLLEQIGQRGRQMAEALDALCRKYPTVTAVRHIGLAGAVELRDAETQRKVLDSLQARRLFVSPTGHNGFMLKPPFTVTARQMEEMAAILEEVLASLT
ncbi:MAG: aspartate aminotransferase family protein [Butyricicoccaceae bacterium]